MAWTASKAQLAGRSDPPNGLQKLLGSMGTRPVATSKMQREAPSEKTSQSQRAASEILKQRAALTCETRIGDTACLTQCQALSTLCSFC
jgi:hypothetical protein